MAGSIALSLTQRYDKNTHLPLNGGQVTFYAAGTTTPQSAYQDLSLTIPWPNPLTLDSGGNVPQLFFADGYIKFRLANSYGVTQIEADYVLVLGPTSGAGTAPSVDATTIYQTGDLKARYGTGTHTGFVRANGRTLGSATSGASERANSDCQALFEYLYGADANLAVSTGRGASANADWVANKTIALPDWRGRALAFLDDMGNSAAGRITNAGGSGIASTTLGAAGGSQLSTIAQINLPAISPTFSGTNVNLVLNSTRGDYVYQPGGSFTGVPTGDPAFGLTSAAAVGTVQVQGSYTPAGTISALGSGSAMATISPVMLATIYMKL